jgi:hypothetical protein
MRSGRAPAGRLYLGPATAQVVTGSVIETIFGIPDRPLFHRAR